MPRTTTLPPGHQWEDAPADFSGCFAFGCDRCGATFVHDLMDGGTTYEPGDGSCDAEEDDQ